MSKKSVRILSWATVSNGNNDNNKVPVSQLSSLSDNVNEITVLYPYGYSANAPLDTLCLVIQSGGESENKVAFPISEKDRSKGLKFGESAIGNWVTTSEIKFLENGDIEISGKANIIANIEGDVTLTATGDVNITAPNTNITTETSHTGNMIITGDLTVTGSINSGSLAASGAVTGGSITTLGGKDLDTHAHLATGLPGQTGPPV